MTPELRKEFEQMKADIQALKNTATIPYEVDSAFRDRLGIDQLGLKGSTKVATSENVSIDEGGVAVKTALGAPDAFKQMSINGTTFYIPVWNS